MPFKPTPVFQDACNGHSQFAQYLNGLSGGSLTARTDDTAVTRFDEALVIAHEKLYQDCVQFVTCGGLRNRYQPDLLERQFLFDLAHLLVRTLRPELETKGVGSQVYDLACRLLADAGYKPHMNPDPEHHRQEFLEQFAGGPDKVARYIASAFQ